MIEAAQARSGRALIGWSQAKLAEAAGLPVRTIEQFESGKGDAASLDAVAKMQAALEAAGVAFIPANGGGVGVRLQKGPEPQTIAWEDLNASNDE